MASISSPGIGSGLDINSILSQLMEIERRPLVQLDSKEAGLQARLSAYGALKGALSSFQTAARALNDLSKFETRSAKSADSTVFSATASSTAVAGSYAVEVKQLAQAQKLASKAFTNTTDTVGTGTLTIQFGTTSGGVFTASATRAAQTVAIDSGKATLAGIRDAINAARVGVSAAILNDGTGNRLVLTSNDSGAANSLKITVADTSDASNTDDAGLSQLAWDPAGTLGNGRNLTETVTAQNALLKVDGIDNISKASNTVTDVIQGVTLTLLKQSAAGTATALTVTQDTASVKTAVEDFVKAYNELGVTIKDLTGYDAATKQGGLLQGDATALAVIGQLRRTFNTSITGLSGSVSTLAQAGITMQKDGTLALDSGKLQTALAAGVTDVAALFAAVGKSSESLIRFDSATDRTAAGSYAVAISQQAGRGLLNGSGTAALADSVTAGTFDAAFAVDANNDTFSLKVDGVQAGTITLAQGSYATAAALVAEIQSKINGDATLKGSGVSVAVSFDTAGDRLVITSERYGSASTVEITSVDTATAATLGLAVGSGSAGVDVAGTINGIAATGAGRMLTGAIGTAAEGLKLEVLGGSSATLSFSRGYAWQLDKLVDRLLADSGTLDSRTDGLNRSIADIAERREVVNRRLEQTEQRLRAQYAALDGLIARLRTTSESLASQLATLPGMSRTQG